MATLNLRKGGVYALPVVSAGEMPVLLRNTIDFGENPSTAADVIQLLDVPAGSVVLWVGYEVETLEGGTLTFDVGDAGTTDDYIDGADGNTASVNFGIGYTSSGSAGKVYEDAGVIGLIPVNNADTAKITVTALVASLKRGR